MRILHVSDLHISGHDPDNVLIKKRLEYIHRTYPDHILVVTGDIVDNEGATITGTPATAPSKERPPAEWLLMALPEYITLHEVPFKKSLQKACDLLRPFTQTGGIFITPGNHDFGLWGNFYNPQYSKLFDSQLMRRINQLNLLPVNTSGPNIPWIAMVQHPSNDNTKVFFIGLDSNLETDTVLDFACGEVGELQLNTLDTMLTSVNAKALMPGVTVRKIVFLHHHPWYKSTIRDRFPGIENVAAPFGIDADLQETTALKDAHRLLEIVSRQEANLLLFGHNHQHGKFTHSGLTSGGFAAGTLRHEKRVRRFSVDPSGGITIDEVTIP